MRQKIIFMLYYFKEIDERNFELAYARLQMKIGQQEGMYGEGKISLIPHLQVISLHRNK